MNINTSCFKLTSSGFYLTIIWIITWMFMTINIDASGLDNEVETAIILNELGLFEGTNEGFELDVMATRNQSAVMLVRYLGIEDYAMEAYKNGDLKHPFKDVPNWASPHVAYLYKVGLTKGVSDIKYGGNSVITGNQYATMILRLLGYDDSIGDFSYDKAFEYMEKINSGDIHSIIAKNPKSGLSRGQMVSISYSALYYGYKNVDYQIIDYLYFNEVISADHYTKYKNQDKINVVVENEVRAIWISYLDLKPIIANKSSFGFRNEIKDMLLNISDTGFNTIFLQVRPFSDALYESEFYEWSYILTGVDGKGLGFDPLEIIIEESKLKNIRVEAWINPFRIRTDIVKEPLNPRGKISNMIQSNSELVIQVGNQLMFNPASDDVQQLIVSGVAEIVRNYDVDGIHFDDYFYPNNDLSLDESQYNDYITAGGDLSQSDYRRERINILVKNVYKTIKELDKTVLFGISPQGSMSNNFNHTFIDVDEWINNLGYIDYICPQLYYGFDNETLAFNKVLDSWSDLVRDSHVKLYIGLAGYKIGRLDNWAGTGSDEWINKNHRLELMIQASRKSNNYNGVAIFRYDSLYKPSSYILEKVHLEVQGIKKIFTNLEKVTEGEK